MTVNPNPKPKPTLPMFQENLQRSLKKVHIVDLKVIFAKNHDKLCDTRSSNRTHFRRNRQELL